MPTIVEGVDFDTVAREWRCKWSADNDKASLAAAQALLVKTKPDIAEVKGVKEVKRIVCGGCLDFKVIIALDAAVYGDWEAQVNEVPSVTPITAHQMLNSPVPGRSLPLKRRSLRHWAASREFPMSRRRHSRS